MWKQFDRSLRYWILSWVVFSSAILLVAMQEATFCFYGPVSNVLGIHLHEKHISAAWQYSILYLLIPIAWLFAWRSKTLAARISIAIGLFLLILILRFFIEQFFDVRTSGGHSWAYDQGPGSAWYGNIQSEFVLSIIADPIHYLKVVALSVSTLPWFAVFNLSRLKQRRLDEARLMNVCFYCNYNLYGSSGGECPECGRRQPFKGEI